MDKFEKDMADLGVGGFVIAAKDPDSDETYWRMGSDILWQYGALNMMTDRHRDICYDIHNQGPEDDYGQGEYDED